MTCMRLQLLIAIAFKRDRSADGIADRCSLGSMKIRQTLIHNVVRLVSRPTTIQALFANGANSAGLMGPYLTSVAHMRSSQSHLKPSKVASLHRGQQM